jgi:hypothetical protein
MHRIKRSYLALAAPALLLGPAAVAVLGASPAWATTEVHNFNVNVPAGVLTSETVNLNCADLGQGFVKGVGPNNRSLDDHLSFPSNIVARTSAQRGVPFEGKTAVTSVNVTFTNIFSFTSTSAKARLFCTPNAEQAWKV